MRASKYLLPTIAACFLAGCYIPTAEDAIGNAKHSIETLHWAQRQAARFIPRQEKAAEALRQADDVAECLVALRPEGVSTDVGDRPSIRFFIWLRLKPDQTTETAEEEPTDAETQVADAMMKILEEEGRPKEERMVIRAVVTATMKIMEEEERTEEEMQAFAALMKNTAKRVETSKRLSKLIRAAFRDAGLIVEGITDGTMYEDQWVLEGWVEPAYTYERPASVD